MLFGNSKKYCSLWLKILLFAFTFPFPFVNYSQTVPYKNYSVKDGLPSSEVYNVMQDSKGYMWFCMDVGVCRFDGYEFKAFTMANGLSDYNILEAKEDYAGRVWFRSSQGKLSYYYNDSLYTLPINDTLAKILARVRTCSFAIDSSDNIYMGFQGLLNPIKISMKNHYAISYLPINADKYPTLYECITPSNEMINGVISTPDSNHTSHRSDNPELRIYKILSSGKLTRLSSCLPNAVGLYVHNKAVKLANDCIASSASSKLIVLDKEGRISFSKNYHNLIFNIVPYKQNQVWVISPGQTPECYNNGSIYNFPELDFLKNKDLTAMAIDAQGGYWFTSLTDGVYYIRSLNFKTWTVENGLPENKITGITSGPDSSLWMPMLLSNKIAVLQNDTIKTEIIKNLPDCSILQLIFYSNNRVLINTTVGLFITAKQNSFKYLSYFPYIGGHCAVLNPDGSVWCCGPFHIQLVKTVTDSIKLEKELTLNFKIGNIYSEKGGNLYIGTINGLYEYSSASDSISYLGYQNPLFKSRIVKPIVTSDGVLWVATTYEGIVIKTGKNVYHLTERDGLINDVCMDMCQDYKDNFWYGTKQGLSHIILDKSRVGGFHIKAINNLTAPYLTEINCIYCQKNMVYVGTNKGLTQFDMNKLSFDTVPPPVYITHIRVNNKIVNLNSTELKLSYDENYLSLNYVGLKYTEPGKVNYRYKLVGADTGWIYTNNTSVQYPKLQPGNYKFMVSAMNDDGVWNQHPASFSFIIAPPIWATWWARVFYIIAVLGTGYLWIRTIQKREKRKTEINKQLVAAELRELKSQFDPHFLFNSLNTLAHLVENKSDDAPDFVYELSKFYRYSLQFRENELMELDKEIKQAKSYIHLIKIRFGDQFKDEWSINEKFSNYLIPTYSLQLLVENAIKHNIINRDKPLTVEIGTTDESTLVVKNKLQPRIAGVASTGHGLESINERYLLLTGKKITISKTADYFCVTLPLIPGNYDSHNN